MIPSWQKSDDNFFLANRAQRIWKKFITAGSCKNLRAKGKPRCGESGVGRSFEARADEMLLIMMYLPHPSLHT